MRHEEGGDKNSKNQLFKRFDKFTQTYNLNQAADYLWYADKLSFFYSNISEYKKRGYEILKKKINFSLQGLPPSIIKQILQIHYDDPEIKKIVDGEISNFI